VRRFWSVRFDKVEEFGTTLKEVPAEEEVAVGVFGGCDGEEKCRGEKGGLVIMLAGRS
jgi:hypothetical protein